MTRRCEGSVNVTLTHPKGNGISRGYVGPDPHVAGIVMSPTMMATNALTPDQAVAMTTKIIDALDSMTR